MFSFHLELLAVVVVAAFSEREKKNEVGEEPKKAKRIE